MSVPKKAVPCADCRTTGGYSGFGRVAARTSGKRFGVDGVLCKGCYDTRTRRAAGHAPRRLAEPLTPEQQRLASDYWALAAKVAGEFKRAYPRSVVDFDGAAAIGLFRAARAWTPDKPYEFATTVRRYAKHACLDDVRSLKIKESAGKESPPTTLRIDDVEQLDEFHSREPETGDAIAREEFIDRLLSSLPAQQASIVRLIFWGGHTTVEAGRTLGIKGYLAGNLRRQALDTLRCNPRILEVAS